MTLATERTHEMSSASLSTPVGSITVVSDGTALVRVTWRSSPPSGGSIPADPLLAEGLAQLRAYFAGELTEFDVPVDLSHVSTVSRSILTTLADTVRHGQTITYGELAERSGTGIPARSIGTIVGMNPVPLVIPCHRVVAADGLGGYSGGDTGRGPATKLWLLDFEGATEPTLF